jgi:hypothetical protein
MAERLRRDIPFPVRELAGLRATAVAHHQVWRCQAPRDQWKYRGSEIAAPHRAAHAGFQLRRPVSFTDTPWIASQRRMRMGAPHTVAIAPRYALSDSSASIATQTSFHLSYHLLYERCPYQVTQRKRPRVFASELPTATTAGAANAHGSCHHSARSGPDCLPLSPRRRSSGAAGEKGRLRANRQRGPGAYT